MNARKLVLATMMSLLLVVALLGVACSPAPAPTPVPTAVPPTAAPKPTEAPKPTTAPTMAPATAAPAAATTAPMAAAFDMKATLDKYFSNLPDGWGTIAATALNDQMAAAKPFIVDIREASEVTAGYIPGAVNIPIRTLMKNLDKLPAKDQAIVVACGSGHRSALGMEALQLLGYTNVKSQAGGFSAWKAANLPVATGTPPEAKAGTAPTVDKDLLAALDKYFTGLPDGWGTISVTALNDQLQAAKPFQVELREASEVASAGYIAGSVNVPTRTLIKNLDKLPADKAAPIITECGSGHRSAMAMMALNLLGYTNVKSMAGGFSAWKAANLPIAGAPAAAVPQPTAGSSTATTAPTTVAPAATTAPMATTAPVAAAFDMKATLDKYFSNLPDGWGTIAPAALNDQMAAAKPFIVDIREASEVTAGYIPGAVNIPIRTLIKNLDKLPAKDQPIVVACGSGHRSAIGMEALQLLGYTNVKSQSGGFSAWKAANLPIATGTPPEAKAGTAPTVDKDLLAALDKYFTALPDGFGGIAVTALNDQLQAAKPFQVDVRETSEYATGFVAGSINIPLRTLIKNLDKLPSDKTAPIIAECGSGHRSAMTMMALNLLGYTNVKSMSGGFSAWKAANLPVAMK